MTEDKLATAKPMKTLELREVYRRSENKEEKRPETQDKEHGEGAMAPPAGCEASQNPLSANQQMEDMLHPVEKQLQHIFARSDELQGLVMRGFQGLQNLFLYKDFDELLPNVLRTCEPFFTYVESSARNRSPGHRPLSPYIRTRLLQFSELLCYKLEQLVLVFDVCNYVSLEDINPLSISPFYIGQCQVDNINLSIFRYCRPAPFLSVSDKGPYKRMRWNVEREKGTEGKREEEEREKGMGGASGGQESKRERGLYEDDNVEYYFLCYEDAPAMAGWSEGVGDDGGMRMAESATVKMWSIGLWVQTYTDPATENILDWVLRIVPQGRYHKLLHLGEEEPSPCRATDFLLEVLTSHAVPGEPAPQGGEAHGLSQNHAVDIFANLYSLSF